MTARQDRLRGREPLVPVVVERAGGGVSRFPPDRDGRVRVRRITREGARVLACDRVSAWRMGPAGQGVRVVTRFVAGKERHEDEIPYPEALGAYAARILRRLSVLSMEDAETVPDPASALKEYLESEGVRALLAVPIRPQGSLAGFLCFEHTDRSRAWGSRDRSYAAALAHQVERIWAAADSPSGAAAPDRSTERATSPPDPGDAEPEEAAEEPEPPTNDIEGGGARKRRSGYGMELRARLGRLRAMETAGILGADLSQEVLELLEIQDGHLALLASSLPGEEGRELLMEIRELGRSARESLEEILRWAREGGADPVEPLELNRLLGGMVGRFVTLTGDRVRLVLAPSAEPLVIGGNSRLLGRAVEHLVRNAREASPEGSRVRIAVLRGESDRATAVARIRVEDQGSGIAPGDLPWIFEPFFTTKDRREAAGLGLALVQAVVEGHGGWVDVNSTLGEGTVFTLNLPIRVSDAEPEPREGDPAAPPSARPIAVLVEDDPHLAGLIGRCLEQAGYRTLTADGVPTAERLLSGEGAEASLVVVERVLLDGSRGAELLRRLRGERPYLAGIILDRRLRGRGPEGEAAVRALDDIAADIPVLAPPFHPGKVSALARGLRPAASTPADAPTGNGQEGN